MPREKQLQIARFVTVIAATIIALACGSNYAYSAWGPQFADVFDLSSTQSNLIATSGNLGMYLCGIPLGKLVDSTGARVGGLFGAVMMGVGYFGLYMSYVNKTILPLAVYCLFTALTGAGGCVAFLGAMKTAAVNFPAHRGTATAFPLAGFGLSAVFLSAVSSLISDDSGSFLLVATWATTTMTAVPCLFLRTSPLPPSYSKVPSEAPQATRSDSNTMLRPKAASKKQEPSPEPGTQYAAVDGTYSSSSTIRERSIERPGPETDKEPGIPSESTLDGHDSDVQEHSGTDSSTHQSLYADVRGFAMLKYSECYELFILVGLLTGTGLMTINNIGQDAQVLWLHWDASASPDSVRKLQRLHVSIISVGSFLGRLSSGIGSDIIVKYLHGSRFWCLFASSCVFSLAQILGMSLENPNLLPFLSATTGLAYGFLFGVAPTLVANTFGVNGFSQNWGFMTLAPALFAELFNMIYGKTYDSHADTGSDKKTRCTTGKSCYQNAYLVTLIACVSAGIITLWCIRHRHVKEAKLRKQEEDMEDDHLE